MPWVKVQFKEAEVWAEVDASGQLLITGGRVTVRYSDKAGAKLYSGSPTRIGAALGGPIELPPGVSADAAGPTPSGGGRGSGFGKAGTRSEAQTVAAWQHAAEQIKALPAGTHMAFTDGACRGNPGPAGAGAVVKLGDGRVLEASKGCGIATNNVGELTAIGLALDLLTKAEVKTDDKVVVFTDSEYAQGVLSKGWKAKANQELIAQVKARMRAWRHLELRWVAGHAGVPENERADQLAAAACGGSR